uniref:Uncharacterized protein n=1 Tax=Aegilops tauschii subsp. strangulata TaxID=200361 RepID=A0A453J8B9_AEGTS
MWNGKPAVACCVRNRSPTRPHCAKPFKHSSDLTECTSTNPDRANLGYLEVEGTVVQQIRSGSELQLIIYPYQYVNLVPFGSA